MTLILYAVVMAIIIPMFNYLQYDKFWYYVSKHEREKFKNQ